MCIVVSSMWNHYQRDQNAFRRLGSGRRRIATTPDDLYLLQCAKRRKALTARQLASHLSAAAGRPMSRQNVSSRLHEGGLFEPRPVVCMPLSPAHQSTSDRSCIGPVNFAVGHQSSGDTYSLRMTLDLTFRTIPEGQ
ncbi:hypothetical protein AVEN_88836-1 [Araneus ventricosus]|uniref:Transposase Tc1-like domain-containing protein n=1 Tax=Araneus ventricosus TaxID=182803 RepID=A0A4Y2HST5_ARAVE|nr:hypothetical protein AVEN_88836-1 [Araneus ventricosus]